MESLQFKSKDCPVPDQKCDGRSVSLASRECLNLLLRLCFDRDEAWTLLASISEEKPLEWLRVGVIYRRLLKAADTNQEHRAVIDNALTRKLDPVSLGLEGSPLCDMAKFWAQRKDSIDSLSAAAMLWHVARSPLPCWRRLEGHIIDDLYYRCVRALALPPEPSPQEECSVCSVGGFTL